jgi:ketosteroid isomerase-like protein
MSDELELLRAQLRALTDEKAVLDTMTRYGHTLDAGDLVGFLDCFVPDAVYRWRAEEGGDWVWQLHGPEEITDWFHRFRASVAERGDEDHFLLNPIVSVDGDTASATSYYTTFRDVQGRIEIVATGRYVDAFVRSPDGRWRIARRELHGSLVANVLVEQLEEQGHGDSRPGAR